MARRMARVMQAQYVEAVKDDHPNLIPIMDDQNIKIWYFLVVDLPPPYSGGEYIFQLTAPDSFPADPPSMQFLTPNGAYGLEGKICISIGEYHTHAAPGADGAGGWRQSLGMHGFAGQGVNGMLCPDGMSGIRIIHAAPGEKARLAKLARGFNKEKHATLMDQFEAHMAANPNHIAVRACKMRRAVASVASTDYTKVDLEILAPQLAEACGADVWAIVSKSLSYLTTIPDLPSQDLAAMGFPASGREVLLQDVHCLQVMFEEYESSRRQILGRAVHARFCLQLSQSALLFQNAAAAADWRQHFIEGFTEFLEHLPGFCGEMLKEVIPRALRANPENFSDKIHKDLSKFLCMANFDEKARFGAAFAARILEETQTEK